jgi:tetraacyldisaccharide-1-P 4'-kinase
MKLHLRLRFFEQGVLPDHAEITAAKPSNKSQIDNLVVDEKDAINIFDQCAKGAVARRLIRYNSSFFLLF